MLEGSFLGESGSSQRVGGSIGFGGPSSNVNHAPQAQPPHTSLPRRASDHSADIFSHVIWDIARPEPHLTACDNSAASQPVGLAAILERTTGFCLRRLDQVVPANHPSRSNAVFSSLFRLASNINARAQTGNLPSWHLQWDHDTPESLAEAWGPVKDTVDVKALLKLGENLPAIVMNHDSAIPLDARAELMNDLYTNSARITPYTTRLARTVKQIVHRHPHMHILEIRCRMEAVTKQILSEIDQKYASYTVTTPEILDQTHSWSNKINETPLGPLEVLREPPNRGLGGPLYDLIVAPIALQAGIAVSSTLQQARQLLKPGGHLVILELIPSIDSFHDLLLGVLTHWWCGGQAPGPGLSSSDWDHWLRKARFSGVDAMSSKDGAMPLAVFTSQAMDESTANCRDLPIDSSLGLICANQIQDLVIIGGDNGMAPTFASQLSALFGGICGSIRHVRLLQDFLLIDVSPETVIIGLVDLDTPCFQHLDEAKWEALKQLLAHSGILIWVTMGRLTSNPHSNMMLGLLRGAAWANPALNYLLLDFQDPRTVYDRTIAEKALQHINSSMRIARGDRTALTIEREMVIDFDQRSWIPRLVMSEETNERHNKFHRSIREQAGLRNIRISKSCSRWSFNLERSDIGQDNGTIPLQVTHSLLHPITVAETGCMFVVMGKEISSGSLYLALTSEHTSIVNVGRQLRLLAEIPQGSETQHLWLVAHRLLIRDIFRGLSKGDKFLVYGPNIEFGVMISEEAKSRQVEVTYAFTNASRPEKLTKHEVSMHPDASTYIITHLSLQGFSTFLDMDLEPSHRCNGIRIAAALPARCRKIDIALLVGQPPCYPNPSQVPDVHDGLSKAIEWTCRSLEDDMMVLCMLIPTFHIDSLPGHNTLERPVAIVDWARCSKVLIDVPPIQPANSRVTLDACKTYWLVGLADNIALLLSRWMVHRGARHFAITSLNTTIDGSWLRQVQMDGVCIKAAPGDVTRQNQLMELYEDIRSSMPEFAGVVQGNLASQYSPIEQVAFQDMTLNQLFAGTRPTVKGSLNLDRLFQETTLDFFVFLSTASSVVGIPRQASCAVGDAFMTSIAERRKRHGLPASIVHCGPLLGVDGVCRDLNGAVVDEATMQAGGLIGTSEEDFLSLFGEAVLAGRPGSNFPTELAVGVRRVNHREPAKPVWASQALMNHLVVDHEESEHTASPDRKGKAPVRPPGWTSLANGS